MVGTTASPKLAGLPRGYRNDRYFGLVYDQVPVQSDDLTIIPGICTREAVALNHLGVFFVAQIASWRQNHVVAFAAELQVPPSQIVAERWVEQANSLCSTPTPFITPSEPPAPFLRTIGLLTSALMIGLLFVYLIGHRAPESMPGVLSADITSLRVPADCRLMAAHVKPGDEVFSSTPLLTLEKLSHLPLLEEQDRKVRQMQHELQQAEAQSDLELAWRSRELDRELFDARTQTHYIQEVQRLPTLSNRTASSDFQPDGSSDQPIHRRPQLAAVSSSRIQNHRPQKAGGLLFFSGVTDQSTLGTGLTEEEAGLPPRPVPTHLAQSRPVPISEPVMATAATAHSAKQLTENLEARIQRLEALRTQLPEQVRQAAGIQHLRTRYQDAATALEEMKQVSRELSITSPGYGIVGQVRFREGDQLAEGDVMLKILHTDRRYVIVHVPSRRVNEMQPGCQVQLNFPGDLKCSGVIADLPMLAEHVTSTGESLVAVRIEPTGRLWPHVPIGSQIDVFAN